MSRKDGVSLLIFGSNSGMCKQKAIGEDQLSDFTQASDEEVAKFIESVEKYFPGGKHIAPHILTGAWWIAAASPSHPEAHVLEQGMSVFPHKPFYLFDGYELVHTVVHLVPEFVYDLMCYESGESFFVESSSSTNFSTKPSSVEVNFALMNLLIGAGCGVDEISEASDAADSVGGVFKLVDLLTCNGSVELNFEQLLEGIKAVGAASTV